MAGTIERDPSENLNWRKHKNACPMYRERWFPCNDVARGEPMYQVFCMQGTPPVTWEEQDRCMHSKNGCWRVAQARKAKTEDPAAAGEASPASSATR